MSCPSTRMRPAVSGMKPATARSTSVLPECGGPRNVKNSPYRTWTLTSASPGGLPPRVLTRSRWMSTSGRFMTGWGASTGPPIPPTLVAPRQSRGAPRPRARSSRAQGAHGGQRQAREADGGEGDVEDGGGRPREHRGGDHGADEGGADAGGVDDTDGFAARRLRDARDDDGKDGCDEQHLKKAQHAVEPHRMHDSERGHGQRGGDEQHRDEAVLRPHLA